ERSLFSTVRSSPWPLPLLPGHAADHGDPLASTTPSPPLAARKPSSSLRNTSRSIPHTAESAATPERISNPWERNRICRIRSLHRISWPWGLFLSTSLLAPLLGLLETLLRTSQPCSRRSLRMRGWGT